jgi:hypothetical protein
MILLDACNSFEPTSEGSETRPLADAFKKAQVRGGYEKEVNALYDQLFMAKFIERYCAGDTPSEANEAAFNFCKFTPEYLLTVGKDQRFLLFGDGGW